MVKFKDLRTYKVQEKPCKTCPFAGEKPVQLDAERYLHYVDNLFGKGQHLCHSAKNQKICRGGREIQLRWLYAIRAISEPTDEAFDRAVNEMMNKIGGHSMEITLGTQVTWTSQSQGIHKTKSGEIMEFVPAGHRIQSDLSLVPKSHLKFSEVSQCDRYLVRVSGGILGNKSHYYCPRASVLKRAEKKPD